MYRTEIGKQAKIIVRTKDSPVGAFNRKRNSRIGNLWMHKHAIGKIAGTLRSIQIRKKRKCFKQTVAGAVTQ